MRNSLFIFWTLTLSVIINFGCGNPSQVFTTSTHVAIQDSPVTVLREYWERSGRGDFDTLETLTSIPPPKFFLCYSSSVSQCVDKGSAENLINKDEENLRIPKLYDDVSMIRVDIPRGISNGLWETYVVKKETIAGEEARLHVLVKSRRGTIDRDFLFYRFDEKWKIIAVVDPDAISSFAMN